MLDHGTPPQRLEPAALLGVQPSAVLRVEPAALLQEEIQARAAVCASALELLRRSRNATLPLLLVDLVRNGPESISALAERLGITKASIYYATRASSTGRFDYRRHRPLPPSLPGLIRLGSHPHRRANARQVELTTLGREIALALLGFTPATTGQVD
jgi:hypothetical protein